MTRIVIIIILLLSVMHRSDAQSGLWGMTSNGGTDGAGVIFKANPNGSEFIVKKNFLVQNQGGKPFYTKMIELSGGKLYGLTSAGGTNNEGVLFEYNFITGFYVRKVDFSRSTMGAIPYGSLTEFNGKLYGTTRFGGANDNGVIFEFDPVSGIYTVRYNFLSSTGSYPYGNVTVAPNGNFYGFASRGGYYDGGVLFEFNPATGTYTNKIDLQGNPDGSFVLAPNGKLYSALRSNSSLIEYDPNINSIVYRTINYNTTLPSGNILLASNGKIYGTTQKGGFNDYGAIYEFDPSTSIVYLRPFAGNDTFGPYPNTNGLVEGAANKIYWMTPLGLIFEYDFSIRGGSQLFSLAGQNAIGTFGTMTYASNGKFYGVTNSGGLSDNGIIFEYDRTTQQFIKKMDFQVSSEGSHPTGSLLPSANGKLYGFASSGGNTNNGVLFEYDTLTGAYAKKVEFDGTNAGSNPQGNMVQLSNGKVYGVTYSGGANDDGTLFEFDPSTGAYAKKFNFNGLVHGANPTGGLIQSVTGTLFGLAQHGGPGDFGTLFEWDINAESMKIRFDFGNSALGKHPLGNLLQLGNQKLYGLTASGGNGDGGVLFEADPVAQIIVAKYGFTANDQPGSNPHGSLVKAPNSKLYGLTSLGGASNNGVLFEFDPSLGYKKKYDFDSSNGAHPNGSMNVGTNGKLYGMTLDGGTQNGGALFEFDPVKLTYTKKYDLSKSIGKNPIYTSLVNFSQVVTGDLPKSASPSVLIYPNPAETILEIRNSKVNSAIPEIYDVSGRRRFLNYETDAEVLKIDIRDLEKGMYIIRLKDDNRFVSVKFVKE